MAKLNLEPIKQSLFKTNIMVHSAHINAGNHLGHDSLVSLIQEAREQLFNSFGVSEYGGDGFGIMIGNISVEYLNEAQLDDELEFKLGLGKLGHSSFELLYQIYNQDHIEIARALTTSIVCDLKTRKSIAIPNKVLDVFHSKA
tara:strand:+ start:6186 stop:6614 length:429 start_codon:yes stop_codon:yes gene_type:complete